MISPTRSSATTVVILLGTLQAWTGKPAKGSKIRLLKVLQSSTF
jgi:hypothetical protein